MKKTTPKILLWGLTLFIFNSFVFSQSESPSFRLGLSLLSEGGNDAHSNNFNLFDAFGFHSLENLTSANFSVWNWMKVIPPPPQQDFYLNIVQTSDTIAPGQSASFQIEVIPINFFNGTVSFRLENFNLQEASYQFTNTSGVPPFNTRLVINTSSRVITGEYLFSVIAYSSNISHSISIRLIIQEMDFHIVVSPTEKTVSKGDTAEYEISVSSSNGYAQIVHLSISGLPVEMGYAFSTNDVTPPFYSTLRIFTRNYPPSEIEFTITGTSSDRMHYARGKLIITDQPRFVLSANPSADTINIPGSTSFTINVQSLNQFSGIVNLSLDSNLPQGITYSFSTTSGFVPFQSSLLITASASVEPGTYWFTVIGRSGDLIDSLKLKVILQREKPKLCDFKLTILPTEYTIVAGQTAYFSIVIDTINCFQSEVSLNITGLPSGTSYHFSKTSFVPPGSCTLSISTYRSIEAGEYSCTVIASGTEKQHTVQITLKISNPPEGIYAYPNPANPENENVKIHFSIDQYSPITIQIFDMSGALVYTLIKDYWIEPNPHHVFEWSGRNEKGEMVANGVYFLVITFPDGRKEISPLAILK